MKKIRPFCNLSLNKISPFGTSFIYWWGYINQVLTIYKEQSSKKGLVVFYDIIKDMNDYEFGKHELRPTDESVDLDMEWTEDYHLDHAAEITELLLSMEAEEIRRPEMEKDATLKANRIHKEVVFNKGEKYQKMISRISSVLNGDGVTVEIPDNINLKDKEYPFDYLISNCLRFNYDSKKAICQAVSDGIFDIMNLEEDERPVLMLVKSINGRVSKNEKSTGANDNKGELGHFREPDGRFHHVDPQAKKNGIVRINLPNFDDEPDIRDILVTLQHECFHAYQFNCRRGTMPIETVRDRVMTAAYIYGYNQYISPKNDYEGYYEQGYESSARSFSAQLTRATDVLVIEAIRQAMKGDANE